MQPNISWFFVLTFPHGGSTALAKLLLTAPGTVELNERAEGQWLVPMLKSPLKRWDPRHAVDYGEVREVWMREVATRIAGKAGPFLVVEKSPPNMCRYKPLIAAFADMPTTMVVMTRDPYATCARWHVKIGRDVIAKQWGLPGNLSTEDAYFEALADIWLQRAALLDAARTDAVETFKYEDFADHPAKVIARLAKCAPKLEAVVASTPVIVKDYPAQAVHNMNGAAVKALTGSQRAALRRGLNKNAPLVESLGYTLDP